MGKMILQRKGHFGFEGSGIANGDARGLPGTHGEVVGLGFGVHSTSLSNLESNQHLGDDDISHTHLVSYKGSSLRSKAGLSSKTWQVFETICSVLKYNLTMKYNRHGIS